MMPSGFAVIAGFALCAVVARAADATSPVDYTQRNTPFAPAGSIAPEKQAPKKNETLQEKRVPVTTIDKATSPLGERRAPIDVKETREKNVREKDSHRPETLEQPKSDYNQRRATISTQTDTVKPPLVSKYQDKLAAASATNMARFPAMDRATGAKINRFVFQKNPPESSVVSGAASVTPAAGGSVIQK
jgi:hypothetical protein